jgi:glycosyltransferase involved in cell wall biosynthesis
MYVTLLEIVKHRLSPLRLLDAVLSYLHLFYLIVFFRPKYFLFLFDSLPRSLNSVCSRLDVTTVTDFGDVPSSKPKSVKRQVLMYDIITAGFELPALWPETEAKFHRILPGPSRDNKFTSARADDEPIDVCVIGGFGGIFQQRTRIVSDLLQCVEEEDVSVHVYGYENGRGIGSRILGGCIRFFDVDDFDIPFEGYSYTPPLREEYPLVAKALRKPVYGEDFYEAFSNSKIILTVPNDPQIAIGSIRPMGIFEPAAAETFQIALNNPDTRNIFEPGEELSVFNDGEELYEKIHYYLCNPDERDRIASNSHDRFLEEYTAETQIKLLIRKLNARDE